MRTFLKTIVAGTAPAFMIARALQIDVSAADGKPLNEPSSQPSTQPSSTQTAPQSDPTAPPQVTEGVRG